MLGFQNKKNYQMEICRINFEINKEIISKFKDGFLTLLSTRYMINNLKISLF